MWAKIDRDALRIALSRAIILRSLAVSVVVGSILNAINQGPDLLAGKPINLAKMILTFAVPFCVASYGAYSALVRSTAKAAE